MLGIAEMQALVRALSQPSRMAHGLHRCRVDGACSPAPKAGADEPNAGVALGLPKGAGEPDPKAGVLAAPKPVLPNAGVEAPKPAVPKAGVLAPNAGVDAAPNAGCTKTISMGAPISYQHWEQ